MQWRKHRKEGDSLLPSSGFQASSMGSDGVGFQQWGLLWDQEVASVFEICFSVWQREEGMRHRPAKK